MYERVRELRRKRERNMECGGKIGGGERRVEGRESGACGAACPDV